MVAAAKLKSKKRKRTTAVVGQMRYARSVLLQLYRTIPLYLKFGNVDKDNFKELTSCYRNDKKKVKLSILRCSRRFVGICCSIPHIGVVATPHGGK